MDDGDALILGSPMYFGSISGEMQSFLERLLFPRFVYSDPYKSLFPKTINTGFIYTMNIPETKMTDYGYPAYFAKNEALLQLVFGSSESLYVNDTFQFPDYSKVEQSCFEPEHKAKRKKDIFPEDCKKAYDMGRRFFNLPG